MPDIELCYSEIPGATAPASRRARAACYWMGLTSSVRRAGRNTVGIR